jgi:hypothetical protein
MRNLVILFVHVIVTLARLVSPGGLRSVVAESALVRHQLLILNRSRKRARPTCVPRIVSSPYSERSLPARIKFRRAFLAYVSWQDKGQFMELRFIPL